MTSADRHPSALELERLLAGETTGDFVRLHTAGCARCGERLKQMGALAVEFSKSSHSQPARQRYAHADRRWRRNAMIVALVPTLAAALVATAALAPRPDFQRPARNALIAALDVRPPAKAPAPLRTVSLRGNAVQLGQGALEGAPKQGPARPFTLKHTEVVAEVTGFVSSVTVTQEFENPFTEPVEAVYVFPLPEDAAVNDMVLTAGNRVTRATIQKRAEARRRYEQAKSEGRSAALLDQERPNIFTQSVANLLPRETVKVTLTYVAPVRYDDGELTLNFPMVVGPRYIPGAALPGQSQGTGVEKDSTEVLDASRISPPAERTGRDISVTVRINAGSPIEAMSSGSHRLRATQASASTAEVTLDPSDRIPNKDLILRWKVAGPERRAAIVASGGAGGTFALMVMPPSPEITRDILPKEMIFLIDTSCSMNGPPLQAAKRAMRSAMEQMNPADTFMLIDFADKASTFHESPLLATPQHVQRAISYLDALPASGGTNQLAGIGRALTQKEDHGRLRMVLLMTDGFIGNEAQILAATEEHLGNARIFGFGIGGSVNHYLLARMSEVGRGFYSYVRPDEDPEPAIERFVRRIERPLLTDVEIDWGGLEVRDVLPRKIPDLFDSQPLILVGRNVNAGRATVKVKGKLRGVSVETRVEVTIPESAGNKALPAIWARARIGELERQQHGGERAEVVEQITTLGLEHHLVTAYTSLVAVGDERIVQPGVVTIAEPTSPVVVAKAPPMGVPMKPRPAFRVHGGDGDGLKDTTTLRYEKGGEDDFDKSFGGGSDSPAHEDNFERAFSSEPKKKKSGPYVPPSQGIYVKESLGPADVFEVVSSFKPALAKCVEEQRKKEPGVTGKLVLRWSITPAGKVTKVEVVSQEFKSTYIAGCIGGLIKTWTFPRHKVAGEPIVFPFKF